MRGANLTRPHDALCCREFWMWGKARHSVSGRARLFVLALQGSLLRGGTRPPQPAQRCDRATGGSEPRARICARGDDGTEEGAGGLAHGGSRAGRSGGEAEHRTECAPQRAGPQTRQPRSGALARRRTCCAGVGQMPEEGGEVSAASEPTDDLPYAVGGVRGAHALGGPACGGREAPGQGAAPMCGLRMTPAPSEDGLSVSRWLRRATALP
jgi:hypothetical protein